jgi:hypothetical protein
MFVSPASCKVFYRNLVRRLRLARFFELLGRDEHRVSSLGQTETRVRFGSSDLMTVANPAKNRHQDGEQSDEHKNPFHDLARSFLSERTLATSPYAATSCILIASIAGSLQLAP